MLFRSAVNAILLAARVRELAPTAGTLREIDLTAGPFPLQLELSSRARSTWDPLVTAHVTDVRGGFGIDRRRVAHWERAGVPPELAAQGVDDPRLVALLERYHRCAYHWLASRAFGGLVVRNHRPGLRTSSSNGGNRGLGFALDAATGEALPPELEAAGRLGLLGCIADAGPGDVDVVAHRVFAAGRREDPGAAAWAAVVRPVTDASPRARIDYELREASGRPIPRTWDSNAFYDSRGRRV